MVTWKTLHTAHHPYLSELITHYLPSIALCSSNTKLLARPSGITSNFTSPAFSVSVRALKRNHQNVNGEEKTNVISQRAFKQMHNTVSKETAPLRSAEAHSCTWTSGILPASCIAGITILRASCKFHISHTYSIRCGLLLQTQWSTCLLDITVRPAQMAESIRMLF